MSPMFWFTAGFSTLAIGVCWYFSRVTNAQRKHDAMIDREEQKIREDARRMREWYREQTARKDAQVVESFLAEL